MELMMGMPGSQSRSFQDSRSCWKEMFGTKQVGPESYVKEFGCYHEGKSEWFSRMG